MNVTNTRYTPLSLLLKICSFMMILMLLLTLYGCKSRPSNIVENEIKEDFIQGWLCKDWNKLQWEDHI